MKRDLLDEARVDQYRRLIEEETGHVKPLSKILEDHPLFEYFLLFSFIAFLVWYLF